MTFSRCKAIARLCNRRSVSAAGLSPERPAMRPPSTRQTTAAVRPHHIHLSNEGDKFWLTEALSVEVGASARLVCFNSCGT